MTPTFRRPETCFKYCVLACTYPRLWREREEPFAGTRTWIFLRARHPEDKRVDKLEKWIRIFSNFNSDGFKDDILQPVGASKTGFTRRTAKTDKLFTTIDYRRAAKEASGTWNLSSPWTIILPMFFFGFGATPSLGACEDCFASISSSDCKRSCRNLLRSINYLLSYKIVRFNKYIWRLSKELYNISTQK